MTATAQADTCDTTCIYNQLVAHQIPAVKTDYHHLYTPFGQMLYYTGPNGLEIRMGRDTTWKVVKATFLVATGVFTLGSSGVVETLGELALGSIDSQLIRNAAKLADLGGGNLTLDQIAQYALQGDLCLGITIKGEDLATVILRAGELMSGGVIDSLITPEPAVNVWFESCSNERAAGLADTASPEALGVFSQTPQAEAYALTIPASSSGTNVQMLVAPDSSVYAKSSLDYGGWTQETTPGNATKIADGGGAQMFLRGDSAVFAKDSISGGGWVQETAPGTANAIAASSTGLQMLIAADASVWAKNSISYGGWSQETTPGNAAAIAVGGNTQMFLRGDSAVFARSGVGNTWTQETAPATASAITVSSTGLQMLIAADGSVWAKYGIGYGGWTQETTPGNATKIAVGGDTQMFIRGDSAVFARNGVGTSWTQETNPGNATAISASANGVQMFLRGDSAVFARSGIGTGWTQETDPASANKIAASG